MKISFYRHHHLNGVEAASRLYERLLRPGGAYKPFLEHIARRRPSARQVVKVKRARPSVPPTLTPSQIDAICDEARKRGIDVVGHVPQGITVAHAIACPMRTLEHFKAQRGA